MQEKNRYSLDEVRKQPRNLVRERIEDIPELIMDEEYLMMQVRLGDARELMKGKVVNVCVSVVKGEITNICPYYHCRKDAKKV